MENQKNILNWIYVVFVLKLGSIAISAVAPSARWGWVPPSSTAVLVVALVFVLSSLVFLKLLPKLGIASTATYGALTFYGATTSLVAGKYVTWSLFASITGLALVGLAITVWRQLSTSGTSTES